MVTAVVGRKDAEEKFVAHSGVGRVGRWPFQIRGILNRQNIFVKHGGIGVLGLVFRPADGFGAMADE